jgi:GNAT superfamily N-acetyltransferase
MVGRDARHRGRRAFRPSLFWWANLLTSLDTLDPPFRRLGVGRRLIEQAIGWARE